MAVWEKIKQAMFPGRFRRQERVRIVLDEAGPVFDGGDDSLWQTKTVLPPSDLNPEGEIDFSRVRDLEAYTENLNVPEEGITRWISAGLLSPDEIRTAERMVQIIRKKANPT